MKKMLLCILLVMVNAMIPADKPKDGALLRIIPDNKSIKSCIVGFKKFTAQDLLNLEEKHREVLNKAAHPSYTERYFGMDNHTVSHERLHEINNLPEEVKADMRFEVLPIKGSLCIQGFGKPNGCCDRGGNVAPVEACGIGGFISGLVLMGATPAICSINSLFCLLFIPAAAAPICGCACGECITCIHFRCCAEREIWTSNVTK